MTRLKRDRLHANSTQNFTIFVTSSYSSLSYPQTQKAAHKEDLCFGLFFVILLVLWALGMVSSYTLGGYIHILLVLAVVVMAIRIIQGRNPV